MALAGVAAEVLVGATGAETQGHLAGLSRVHRTIGFEAAHVSVQQHAAWAAAFGCTLVATIGVVEAERRTKDTAEIELIAQACRIADQALAEVVPTLGNGLTEAQVRNQLEIRMRELGAVGPSYDTIVATGPLNAALPHHRPTDAVIEDGHTVIIDVGALVDGYHSDMTRTFVIGRPYRCSVSCTSWCWPPGGAGRGGCRRQHNSSTGVRHHHEGGFGDWFTHGTGHESAC
jgi:Xaa-Pro aminopeptidase